MSRLTNLVGKRFGKLVVTEELPPRVRPNKRKRRYLKCACDCGGVKISSWDNLHSKAIACCGCTSSRHGGVGTKLYGVWHGMIQRCTDKNYQAYSNYGGRGITVCSEWTSFRSFRAWAIESGYVEGLSIERIDNDDGYHPQNCTWIQKTAQSRNRRTTVWVQYNGNKITATEYSKITNTPLTTVLYRLRSGVLNGVQKP